MRNTDIELLVRRPSIKIIYYVVINRTVTSSLCCLQTDVLGKKKFSTIEVSCLFLPSPMLHISRSVKHEAAALILPSSTGTASINREPRFTCSRFKICLIFFCSFSKSRFQGGSLTRSFYNRVPCLYFLRVFLCAVPRHGDSSLKSEKGCCPERYKMPHVD